MNNLKPHIVEAMIENVAAGKTTLDNITNPALRAKIAEGLCRSGRTADPRKMVCRDLETAADRVNVVGGIPATSKQCWFLAGLLAERNLTADAVECGCLNTQAMLTKQKASQIITELKGGR